MQQYFNRNDREHHIIMMVFYNLITDWLDRNKSLTKEEKRYIRTGLTWIKKGYNSMIVRSKPDYIRTLKNTAMHCELYLEDTTGKTVYKDLPDTRTVLVDDIYDLAEFALCECARCSKSKEEFESCGRYKMFMKMSIPPVTENTDDCPYR